MSTPPDPAYPVGARRARAAPSRIGLVLLSVLSLAGFVLGARHFGLKPGTTAGPQAGVHGGCAQSALRFGFTDDGRVVTRQRVFEQRMLTGATQLPPPRFHTRPVEADAALHAVTHAFVLVYYRAGFSTAQLAGLRTLESLAVAQKAPVLVAPREQAPALVALRLGVAMTCAGLGPSQVRQLRAFAATLYPSLTSDRRGPPAPAPAT